MGTQKILDELILPLDAFLRSIEINKNIPHSVLLGAGASITSGISSADLCVWQWKREVFLSQNSGLERKLFDISLPNVKIQIQEWLDKQGEYPKQGSTEEYGFYAEKSFPIPEDRRKYFQNLSNGKYPHVGYQYLSLLGKFGLVTSVWTTNFDGLVAKAMVNPEIDIVEVGLDSTDRLNRSQNPNEVLSVSLHGDYRYDALKNTQAELQTQDKQLRNALIGVLKNTSLIISGYSGRDNSIMETLLEGFTQPGIGRLYWCGYENHEPDYKIKELISKIKISGREAFYIPTLGFDDLFERLAFHCLDRELLKSAKKIREDNTSPITQLTPFSVKTSKNIGLIKSNAFEVELPHDVLQFQIREFTGDGFWRWIRNLTRDKQIVAAPLKGNILAFGSIVEIKEAFSECIVGKISRVPISDKELTYDDSVLKSLMVSALVKALAEKNGLNSNNRNLIWKSTRLCQQEIKKAKVNVFEAVNLSLKQFGGKSFLLLKPTIEGRNIDGSSLEKEINQELRRLLLTKQYNSQFNHSLDSWRKILFTDKRTSITFPRNSHDSFSFNIRATPAFAEIGTNSKGNAIAVPQTAKVITHKGILLNEPVLIFSNQHADGFAQDTHQLRGILRNQPFDYALTKNGMLPNISIGVICPSMDSWKLSEYLSNIHKQVKVDSKREYLLDFPGFSQAFGIPLNLPEPNQNSWNYCGEPSSQHDARSGANILKKELIKNIESLKSSSNPNVIVIFVPNRWKEWESYIGNGEKFDLHDFIKAYCVQKGISTQFIRESTLSKSYRCEIIWWLAQSLYTKAMRTPWILKEFDDKTAFVGIGYGLDFSRGTGKHVILGCSHIYGSNGQGLKYKLSKIENPILRRENPFMSRDDARRVGDSIRQMFFESFQKLPQRVVIHKRNYFSKEEKEGLSESLCGAASIDMLEIQFDPMLRYVASKIQNGKFFEDGYPVRRGTAIILGRRKAAIWVHGTADAVNSGRRYYQGKSRIPAPLVVTRHYGNSSLQTLATEILGLSKMNWNNFDLYSKLPATIESSKAIAKIGLLLDRFSNYSYDYRLFF